MFDDGGELRLTTSQFINFIDQQDHRRIDLLYLLEEVHILLRILHHVGDIEQHISILKG